MRFDFVWDSRKAETNRRKHGVSFERASTIFRDPHILSVPDMEHSDSEDRWISVGCDTSSVVLVVVHTFKRVDAGYCTIRIVSSRRATSNELEQYEEGI
ncbi:MAG: BrnT family toxin [Acidobacteria bacterium]|nr:BrnT family toxin [Acidobacteriota bacterium]MBK8146859.1 BrnT family toxin [Acidobacteriota bacterium]MBK8813101.1 BrnT family toxin [Acidobacteriota bacterium]